MSNTPAARKTILESIYSLRRRRSLLPLSDVSNTLRRASAPQQRKSLVQGIGHSMRNPSRPSASCMHPRNALAGTCTNTLTRPSLLNNGVREHYAATNPAIHGHDLYLADIEGSRTESSSNPSNILSSTPKEQSKSKLSDLIVVLDLDECLIHSQFLNTNESYRQYEDRPPSHAFAHDDEPSSIIPSACESFRMTLPDGDLVHVHKRPNLDDFLKELTNRFETHIFTAAMEVYASPLLDRLDPQGTMFDKRYYRETCTFDPTLGVYVKDLQRALTLTHPHGQQEESDIEYDGARVVLVDNNPMSFLANPTNGILVSNFYDDPRDDTLLAVLDLLEDLDQEEDVRPILDRKFGLRDALREAVQGTDGAQSSWR